MGGWPAGVLDCAGAAWAPGIGDPTVTGWLTVLLYACAAVAAGAVVRAGPFPRRSRGRERLFWAALALLLAALALNKQLDLQSFLTATARCMALEGGWYAERRRVQVLFVAALGATALAGGLILLLTLRGTRGRSLLALLGAVLVVGFVMIRAVGFHHIDRLIGVEIAAVPGLRLNFALEAPGPLLIVANALWLLRARRGGAVAR